MATADVLAAPGFANTPTAYNKINNGLGHGNNGQVSPTASSTYKNGNGNGNGNGTQKVTYEDPEVDVSLKSNDGRIFKVESYVLKTHSTYFRNQFKSQVNHDPIPIDASTKILKGFLDIMHMRPVPSGMVWAYKDRLLALADTLGAQSVAERAVFSMHESVQKDPWGVFCLASQRGNLSLAKAALKCLADTPDGVSGNGTEGGRAKIDKLTPQLAAGVTLPYLLGLFNAALGANGHFHINGDECPSEDGHVGGGSVGWKAIAERFTPVVG